MENIEYSFTDSFLDDSADNFSFGQASGSVDAQGNMTRARKFNPTYVVPRHHSAYQHVFPPNNTWEEPVLLSGEPACNVDPFEGIDWNDVNIQALVKEALNMTPPAPSKDIPSCSEFASLLLASDKHKSSCPFGVAATCSPASVVLPPSSYLLSAEPHFSPPSSPQVPVQMANMLPSSGIQLSPLPPILPSSTTCATNVTGSHNTTDAHDAGPSMHRPSVTQNLAEIPHGVDNSSWHTCNPGRPTLPIRHSEPLTDAQKAMRRIANEERKRKEGALSDTVKKLAEELGRKIADITQEHSIAVEKISKLLTGHINYKRLREVSFSNALIQAKALEVNTGKNYNRHTYLSG